MRSGPNGCVTIYKAIEWLKDRTRIGSPSLIECAKELYFYHLALRVQCGDDINVRDEHGRNLLQIALEDARPKKEKPQRLNIELAEFALLLLCGLKLKLSEKEIEQAKAICLGKEYHEALNAITSAKRLS